MTDEIREMLLERQDIAYRDSQSKLIPTVDKKCFIGVRTPALRKLAKQLYKEGNTAEFLQALPHRYFDENQLHAFIISEYKDFEQCIAEVSRFLPYIDNWATCDQLLPKVFKKHRDDLLPYIEQWLHSDKEYTVRFAIGLLMQHFLDEKFDIKYAQAVAAVPCEAYYIHMMVAWYFATALAKQYNAVLPFFEQNTLDERTHNKAIQKAIESYRISPEQKEYLKSLKRKKDAK